MSNGRDTAEMILQEAQRIIEERGEAALRVTELADKCGVAVGLLYHYFKDRGHLVKAVREAQFIARVESDILYLKNLSESGDNQQIVDTIINQFTDPRNEERNKFRIDRMEVLAMARHRPELRASLTAIEARLAAEIMNTIRNAKANGLVAEDVDDKSLGFFLEMLPIGAALGTVYGDYLPDPDKWREFMFRVLSSLMPSN